MKTYMCNNRENKVLQYKKGKSGTTIPQLRLISYIPSPISIY